MKRFKPVIVDFSRKIFQNTSYISRLFFLYLQYAKYLDDDFASDERPLYRYFVENIQRLSPFFWAVIDERTQNPAGFVYLDKLIGNSKRLHCAEVSACFFPKYWGNFTFDTGKKFFAMCFEELGFYKLKALIYPQNFRVITLLKKCGFKKEGYFKAETLCRGRLQDIEVHSLIKERLKQ